MNTQEAAALLAIAAAFDNRKPDADAAQAWALQLDGLPFADCRDAVMAHYRTSSEWLMPKDVIGWVRRVRDKRIAEAGDLCPPPGLDGDQERAWLGQARRRIADGATRAEVESEHDYGELRERHLPDLRRLLPSPADVEESA